MDTKKCITCYQIKSTEGGTYSEQDDLFQCKECIMKDLTCLDCERLVALEKSLVFDEGNGRYWILCPDCLKKSHTLLILLKDQKKKKCWKLVKKGFKIADEALEEELAIEKANAPPKPPPPPKPVFSATDKEKAAIQNACDIILGVSAETMVIHGRDGCQESLRFKTSDYNYEFQIGCHNANCGYIDVFSHDASFDLCFYSRGIIELTWHGKLYETFPDWIPWKEMRDHCTEIIKTLKIKTCDKKFH